MSNEPQITPEAKRTDEACRHLFGDFLAKFQRVESYGGGLQYRWAGGGWSAEFVIRPDGLTRWALEGLLEPVNGIFNFSTALGHIKDLRP